MTVRTPVARRRPTFAPHPLHAAERTWTETNCYVDVWIEVLHALGLDPVAGVRLHAQLRLRGRPVDVLQVPARGPADPVRHRGRRAERLAARSSTTSRSSSAWAGCARSRATPGSCPTPGGVSYGTDHVKTTIVPAAHRPGRPTPRLLPQRRLLRARRATTSTGSSGSGAHADPAALPPYVERIRLDRVRRDDPDLVAAGGGPDPRPPGPPARRQPGAPDGGPPARRTCRGWPARTSRPSTSTRSACAASAAPAPSWPRPSSTG